MVEIINPTRMMPRGLQFVSANPAIESGRQARQDIQSGWRFEQEKKDRQQQDETDEALKGELQKWIDAEDGGYQPNGQPFTPQGPLHDIRSYQPPSPSTPPLPPVVEPMPPADAPVAPAPAPSSPPDGGPPIPKMQPTPLPAASPPNAWDLQPSNDFGPGGMGARSDAGAPMPPIAPAKQVNPVPHQPPVQVAQADTTATDMPAPVSPLSQVRSSRPDQSRLPLNVARALANVNPRESLKYLTQASTQKYNDWQHEGEITRQVLDLADQGQMDKALSLARQYGETIDPRVLANGNARQVMRIALDVGKAAGADHDQAWMEKFTQAMMQTGDIKAALQAAGRPTAPIKTGRYKQSPTGDVLDTATGTVQKGVGTPALGKGAGQVPAQIQWFDRVAKVLGSEKAALEWMGRAKTNPASERTAVVQLARALMDKDMTIGRRAREAGKSPAQLAMDEAAAAVQAFKASETPLSQDGGASAPAAPSPASPAATPFGGSGDPYGEGAQWHVNDAGEYDAYTLDGGKTWWNPDGQPFSGDYE